MTPDDPRHGTYAGYMAHLRGGTRSCLPCLTIHRRTTKRAKIRLANGVRNRIPVGLEAWEILNTTSLPALAEKSGLNRNNLYLIQRGGPDKMVLRSTRDAILAASNTHTPVGIQRRLQALSALGFCMSHLAPAIGAHPEPLVRMMRRSTPPVVVKSHVARGVVTVYDELHMAVPPTGRQAARRRSAASARGWSTPWAWDDIDTDITPATSCNAEAGCSNKVERKGMCDKHYRASTKAGQTWANEVDPVVVVRLMGGERIDSTRAEKDEAMRRWRAAGKSEKSLCELLGWKHSRYGRAAA